MKNKWMNISFFLLLILTIIVSGIGLFYSTNGTPFEVINKYGETIMLYGKGTYAFDSYFKAPIFRGSDCIILFVICPILLTTLLLRMKKVNIKIDVWLLSIIGVILYYACSVAIGVSYNQFLLLYIALFSLSFFLFIGLFLKIDKHTVIKTFEDKVPYKAITVYLVLSGLSLFVAWLPDIIFSILNNEPLELLEVYTTEITYVLDMAIISPVAFLTIYLLRKKSGSGYILLEILLMACGSIGLIVIGQSVFQYNAGIYVPIPALITKVGIFIILSGFSFAFLIKMNRKLNRL